MHTLLLYWIVLILFLQIPVLLSGQDVVFHGQTSGWLSYSASTTASGVRYLPEASLQHSITEKYSAAIEAAANIYISSQFSNSRSPSYPSALKPYRLWGRISADQYELRLGLQKINFGPAVMFRPLMWFDAVDPRDPLQMTDGVYAMLARYYFPDNSNLWLWGLYGNNDRKGMETAPTERNSIEFGGRVQVPVWTGEIGATYHHRSADMASFTPTQPTANESRYALDGKWDVGIGVWFEGVIIDRTTSLAALSDQRIWTVGADYTFGIGNGMNVMTEYFRIENPHSPLGPSEDAKFSALSLSYPLSIMDRVSGIFYRDWIRNDWYRLVSVQRTYDNWIVFVLGFWNPSGAAAMNGSNTFAGTGAQIMVVFNH